MKRTITFACALALVLAAWAGGRAGAAPRCYPNKRFVIIDEAQAKDTLTNLVWQRKDNGVNISWDAAQVACPSSFRVPTIKELYSIVDTGVTSGATLDQTVFLDEPANYWSSTRVVATTDSAYTVNTGVGAVSMDVITNASGRVRCVR